MSSRLPLRFPTLPVSAHRRVRVLSKVTQALLSAVTTEEVVRVMLRQGMAAFGADNGAVLLKNAEGGLTLVGAAGYEPEVEARYATIAPESQMPVMRAMRENRVLWLEDMPGATQTNPELAVYELLMGTASGAALPLWAGETRGAMALTFVPPREFPPDDRAFMTTLARQCAQALDRAGLYTRARQDQAHLRAL
ncbi:GAF domain-containing protein [Deinococcus sp. HMF7604]|uniref:GAF domain-containing protein n=1 Tax=Deinococcus betulae TaxID=2873312 RepID=UPI001CCA1390|nr:GAF domain-containing protein [Deinococcus betulae]MBZ9751886.1 GAF domain-containing protein [Deinococcus betulae]